MTLNGVMAVILRYFSEFGYPPGVLRKSSRSLSHLLMSFWATAYVCKTVRPMLSVRCLSVLSVTLVYCDQTVGRIKMKLGVQL